MKIAIDISPLSSGHSIRGQGFYLSHLKKSLEIHFPKNDYIFFSNNPPGTDAFNVLHYPYFEPFSKPRSLSKQNKTVITVHDLTPLVLPDLFPSGIKGKIKWQLQKQYLKNIGRIITDSEASKNDIVRLTGINKDKVDVVYLAAGEEFEKKDISKLKSIKDKYNLPEKFVLYVGDVTPNKNLSRLANACVKKNIPLVMVGKSLKQTDFDRLHPWNKDLVYVQTLAEKNKSLHILGFLSNDDLVAIYNLATVFAFPSLYEGFGLPVLEAMQCGLPVVTADAGSLKEVAGDAAEYVDPYREDSIGNGIASVFGNMSKQNDLQKKGLSQAKKFSWKKTAEETIKAYERVSY